MNFLSHALPYLDEPLVAVSTAVPDWLSVVDRKIRAREKMALAALDGAEAGRDQSLRDVASGIIHHIRDDRWFHSTAAFVQTNLDLAIQLRDLLPGDRGFRPMFVGHVVIEVYLDALWIRSHPDLTSRYYHFIDSISPELIESCVNRITGKPTNRLADTIRRYARARFLYDYLDHGQVLFRLNQVMRRVGLAKLPDSILPWLRDASNLVESRSMEFLTRPDGSNHSPALP